MSQWSRYASTDSQEASIKDVEKFVIKAGLHIVGGTTIGKSPQTVILDLTYQGGQIYINVDGEIEVYDETVYSYADFKSAVQSLIDEKTKQKIKQLENDKTVRVGEYKRDN